MKSYQPYIQYLVNEKLIKWFDLMKEDFEEPVVKCSACGTEFKNNASARFIQDDQKFYACSGDCKAKLANRVRKEKKDKEKKDAISQMLGTESSIRSLSSAASIVSKASKNVDCD
jgi:hypothetical protein